MSTVDELFEAFKSEPVESDVSASSGFLELDDITGGFRVGQVWIVIGAPGQGKTTLLTQWASQLAVDNWQTRLVCPREPRDFTAARLLACTARVPLPHLRRGEPSAVESATTRTTLIARPLHVAVQGQLTFLDRGDPAKEPPFDAILIDDADLAAGVWPKRVASFVQRGALVILSMPRHVVVEEENGRFLDPTWARLADVVIEVRQADWPITQSTLRPGEADLFVLKNRWGPTRTVTVCFQGHYARFVDFKG